MMLNEKEREKLNKISKKLGYEEEIKEDWELLYIIEELMDENERLEEKYKDLEQDLQDNYRPIPLNDIDMYGDI